MDVLDAIFNQDNLRLQTFLAGIAQLAAEREAERRAIDVVVSAFLKSGRWPRWATDDGEMCLRFEVVRNGPYTVVTGKGNDGRRRVGVSRRKWTDEDDPYEGTRHALGRYLDQP